MVTCVSVQYVLFLVFVSLVQGNNLSARGVRWPNQPLIGAPPNPPLTDYQKSFFTQTIKDAVRLARHTILYWPCEPGNDDLFKRYFDPADAEFVNHMFRAIANVDMALDLNDDNNLITFGTDPFSYNPRFPNLDIQFLEDNPRLKPENGGPGIPSSNCANQANNKGNLNAYLQNINGGNNALMSVCREMFQLPMIDEIIKPPTWARDPQKAGNPPHPDDEDPYALRYYDGYGCRNIGDADSQWMETTALTVLHEILHWPGLFGDVPNYAATIPPLEGSSPTNPILIDFHPLIRGSSQPDPADGYGAWNCMQINRLTPLNKDKVKYKSIYNPENYAWYASSRYFSDTCEIEFKAAESQDAFFKDRFPPKHPF